MPGSEALKRVRTSRRVVAETAWTERWMDGFAEMPFDGEKESGVGRGLGRCGLEEFLGVETATMRIGCTRTPGGSGAAGQDRRAARITRNQGGKPCVE